MKAAWQDRYGPPEVVEVRDIETPTPIGDEAISNCTPNAHFTGTVVRSIEPPPPSEGVASLSVLAEGGPGQDIELGLKFADSWLAACDYGSGPGDPVTTDAGFAFPGCAMNTAVTALFDSKANSYVINCQPAQDLLGWSCTVTGHVSGTLTPADATSPNP